MTDTVLDIVRQALQERLGLEPGRVHPESRFVEDLEMDSLLAQELLQALVERLEVRVDPMETAGVATVGELVELLVWKLERKS